MVPPPAVSRPRTLAKSVEPVSQAIAPAPVTLSPTGEPVIVLSRSVTRALPFPVGATFTPWAQLFARSTRLSVTSTGATAGRTWTPIWDCPTVESSIRTDPACRRGRR